MEKDYENFRSKESFGNFETNYNKFANTINLDFQYETKARDWDYEIKIEKLRMRMRVGVLNVTISNNFH